MMAFPMLQAVLGLLHTILAVGLFCILFRKAGLRGGIFFVAFLPAIGMLANAAIPAALGGLDTPYAMILLISAVSAICYLTPLLILAVLQWPALNNSRAKVEIFK